MSEQLKVIEEHCKAEIEWARAKLDEAGLPGNPHNYQDYDIVYLPCWKKAHEQILGLVRDLKEAPTDADTPEQEHEPHDAVTRPIGCVEED